MKIEITSPDSFIFNDLYVRNAILAIANIITINGFDLPRKVTINFVSYVVMEELNKDDPGTGVPYGFYYAVTASVKHNVDLTKTEYQEMVFNKCKDFFIRYEEKDGTLVEMSSIILLIAHEFGHLIAFYNDMNFDQTEHEKFADSISDLADVYIWDILDLMMEIPPKSITHKTAANLIKKWSSYFDDESFYNLVDIIVDQRKREKETESLTLERREEGADESFPDIQQLEAWSSPASSEITEALDR